MDLAWINDFLALADTGGFSRAAEQRHATQPAFSRRIRALESWVGTALVDRSTHRIALTAAGDAFRAEIVEVARRLGVARKKALDAAAADAASVAIASTHMLASTFLPGWFARSAPDDGLDDGVQVLVDTMAACERLMLAGRVGLLLCHHHDSAPSPLESRDFQRTPVGSDTLIAVCAPDAKGRPRHPLGAEGAPPTAYLAFREEAGLGRILDATVLAAYASRLRPVFRSHAALTLVTMARAGRGMVFAPESLVGADLAGGTLVRAAELTIDIEICAIRVRARQRAAFEALWSRLRAAIV